MNKPALLALLSLAVLSVSGCHQVHEARARNLTRTAIENFFDQDFDRALEHADIALDLGSEDPTLHRIRAAIFMIRFDGEGSLAAAEAGIAQIGLINADPHHPLGTIGDTDRSTFHYLRGSALQSLGRVREGREAFTEAVTLDPGNIGAQNNLGWLLATSPGNLVRDGKLAVIHATEACELSEWKSPGALDTLAAAYAEAGDFRNAVRWQQEAIDLFDTGAGPVPEEEVNEFRARLTLYQGEEPYREDPQAKFEERSSSAEAGVVD